MKKTLILLFALLPFWLHAQESTESLIRENILRACVNTCPYEYRPAAETPVPKGYKAFYISHYGRHGARTDWAPAEYDYGKTLALYNSASAAGLLTPEGEAVRAQIAEIIRLVDGMGGRLTELGAQEHRQIASRMYKHFRKVFRQGSRKVRAVASISPRCLVSMAASTSVLTACDPSLDISWDSDPKYMRFMVTDSPKHIRAQTDRIQSDFRKAHVPDTAAFLARIFTDPAKARPLVGDAATLMLRTFFVALNTGCFELDPVILRAFKAEDLARYEECTSQEQYLRHCNSLPFGDERMKLVRPLSEEFVGKAEDAIAGGNCVADLRYGHDSQLIAFASLLGIEGIGERRGVEDAAQWRGCFGTPFASNLQTVFYRDRRGDILVKFYYNEREARLLTLPDGPYYRWSDVKSLLLR